MGMGMVVAISSRDSVAVEEWLASRMPGCRVVGEVVSNGSKVTHADPEVVFSNY
jgi:phosphoribosylaminoimidazole (AIR) synthetase